MAHPKPFITQIQAEGTTIDRQLIRAEVRQKVAVFLCRIREGEDKTEALYHLVKSVEAGQEDIEVLQGVVSSGHWLLELAEVKKRITTDRAYRRLFGKERG